MGNGFKETAHLKTDLKKYQENYDSIDWGNREIMTNDEVFESIEYAKKNKDKLVHIKAKEKEVKAHIEKVRTKRTIPVYVVGVNGFSVRQKRNK